MKIVITAYKPFLGEGYNSALEVVKNLNKNKFDVEVETIELPVIYDPSIYEKIILDYNPDILLLCGQAGGRKTVDIEYQGLNLMHASTPDEDGKVNLGEVIFEDGPTSLLATIPSIDLVKSFDNSHLSLSLSAGGYICNMGLYSSLYYAKKHSMNIQIGFIHFPLFNYQRDDTSPSMDIQLMTELLDKIINKLIIQ